MTDLFIVLLYTFLTASKLLNVVHIVFFIILIIWILYIATMYKNVHCILSILYGWSCMRFGRLSDKCYRFTQFTYTHTL